MKTQIEAVGSDDIFEGYWETTTGKTLYPVEQRKEQRVKDRQPR